jgi:hypothetical protein
MQGLCESLMRCENTRMLDVIFWCDSPINSRKEAQYTPLQKEVFDFVTAFIELHSNHFCSVELKTNEVNLGTCKTCQVAMDYAFKNHDFGIFVEDDVIFSSDAIRWFLTVQKQGLLKEQRYWAIAGESIFFNAQHCLLPEGWQEEMLKLAIRDDLSKYYITHNFLPSTCFATTAKKWEEFGDTRGQSLGDVDVCSRCASEGRYGIFPVVPRVKDIGMLHENGFSVLIHTASGVSEIKNTYLMAEDLYGDTTNPPERLVELQAGVGELFTQTTKLIRINR